MNRIGKVVLLSLIAIAQVVMIVGGLNAFVPMSESMNRLQLEYKRLYEETHEGIIIDYFGVPNPFVSVAPWGLLGLSLTVVLLFYEVRPGECRKRDLRE